MTIEFTCPVCGAHGAVDDSRAGQDEPCRCGVVLVVPRKTAAPASTLTLASARVDQDAPRPRPALPQFVPQLPPASSRPRGKLPGLCLSMFLLDALACSCYALVCLSDLWWLGDTPLHLYSLRSAAIVASASILFFGLVADVLLLTRHRFGLAFAGAALFVTAPAIIVSGMWYVALLNEPAREVSRVAGWRALLALVLWLPLRLAFNGLYVAALVKFVRWKRAEAAAEAG